MKRYFKIALLIAVTFITKNTFAETFKFKVNFPSNHYSSLYPNLDLNQLDSIEVTAKNSMYNPELEPTRLKLVFPNATDLVVSNFSRVGGTTYSALVQNAWVFRQLMVEVDASSGFSEGNQITARVSVVELSNNLNNTNPSPVGPTMLDISGTLFDITANKLADVANIKVDGKNLNLRLYQHPQSKMNGQGFVLDANWLGHGEATLVVPVSFPLFDFHNFKAVSISVDLIDGGPSLPYNIIYQDPNGMTSSVTGDLRPDLDMAFPPLP